MVVPMNRVPPPPPDRDRDATWQWLTAMCEQAHVDWLNQEIFFHITQAFLHDSVDELVWSQSRILAKICPTGVPTREQWLWSWRLSNHIVNDHRRPEPVMQVFGVTVAHA
jgi:hypothetical protein